MKCQECEPLLEEYLDGELDRRAAAQVAAHLSACAACREAHEGLTAEQSLYAAYEREVEVTPELWGGIEARLRAERRVEGEMGLLQRVSGWLAPLLTAPRFSPALTAALVVAAVVCTVGATRLFDSRGDSRDIARGEQNPAAPARETATAATPAASTTPEQHQSVPAEGQRTSRPVDNEKLAAGTPPKQGIKDVARAADPKAEPRVEQASLKPPKPREQTPDQLVREAEQRYIAAIRILERDVKNRRPRLDEQTLARFDETLASIDRTIAETRKSVRKDGADPVAVQYMLSAYAKKVEVMREMAHLGAGND